MRTSLGTAVDDDLVAAQAPDVVVDATGSVAVRPAWADDAVLDVEDVLRGGARPRGRVLVVDEAGGHAAPSAAELLARAGATVTTVTSALVAAGDLGPTLEGPRWARRAAALGIGQEVETVVLGRRARARSGSCTTSPGSRRPASSTRSSRAVRGRPGSR